MHHAYVFIEKIKLYVNDTILIRIRFYDLFVYSEGEISTSWGCLQVVISIKFFWVATAKPSTNPADSG